MKDTLITAKAKRREIIILLCCFVVANIINISAIAYFDSKWSEVYSQLGYVVCITLVIYVLQLLFRSIICRFMCRKG